MDKDKMVKIKSNRKGEKIMILLLIFMLILISLSNSVSALGIASDYLENNTITLGEGASGSYGIRIQNNEDREIKVFLEYDNRYFSITGGSTGGNTDGNEFFVEPNSVKSINFAIGNDLQPGLYETGFMVYEIGLQGFSLQLNKAVKIKVEPYEITAYNKFWNRKPSLLAYYILFAIIILVIFITLIKRDSGLYKQIKFYGEWAFKIGMLLFGIVNLFGYFDLTGKILAAVLLFILWLGFEPSRFLFGSGKKWLDYTILIAFYIFALDTFTTIIQTTNYNPATLEKIDFYLRALPEPIYSAIISFSLYVYHSGAEISYFSANFGFVLLIAIAFVMSIMQKYEKSSMIHPLVSLFNKEEAFWNNFSSTRLSRYTPVKIFVSLIVLLIFSHYFFNLINQWFIVTIGNSTFIIAFFLNIKDLKNTGYKVLDRMGNFDEELIMLTKKIFYDKRYFIFGFSILLAFHFISDATLFLVPYFVPTVGLDEYYINVLNQGPHLPLIALFNSESIATLVEKVYYSLVYAASALGLLFLFMFPVIILFMFTLGKHLKEYLEKKHHRILLYVIFIATTIFLIAPWTKIMPIIKDASGNYVNVQGVDFITSRITDSGMPLMALFTIMVLLAAIAILFQKSKKLQEYAITITFLYSLIFLGKYVWNFYVSTFFYYINLLDFSYSTGNALLVFLFVVLFVTETLFYLGGFTVLGYYASRYIITQKTRNIMTEKLIYIYTGLFFMIPTIMLAMPSRFAVETASIIIASLLIFSFALYREFKGTEYWDDYILGVSLIIAALQFFVVTSLYPGNYPFFSFIQPVIILLLSLFLLRLFRIKINFLQLKISNIAKSVMFGLVFGAFFYLITEPSILQIKLSIGMMLFYLIFVALSEELLFRGTLLRLADKAFPFGNAVLLQSFVFASIHFIGIKGIFAHYSALSSSIPTIVLYVVVYFALLFAFGIVASFLSTEEDKNITYPIIFHFVTNAVLLLG